MMDVQTTLNVNNTILKPRIYILRESLAEGQRYELSAYANSPLSYYLNFISNSNTYLTAYYARADVGAVFNTELSIVNIQVRSGLSVFQNATQFFGGYTTLIKYSPFSIITEGYYLDSAGTFLFKLNYSINSSLSAFYRYDFERSNTYDKYRAITSGFQFQF